MGDMNKTYNIVGEAFEVHNIPVDLISYLEGFESKKENASSGVVLEVKNVEELPAPAIYPTVMPVFGIQYAALHENNGVWKHILTVNSGGGEYLLANSDWSRMLLALDFTYRKPAFMVQPRWAGLIMCGFYLHLSFFETLLLHASAVEYKGRAVVFTAPSGTGKTTQAELWKKYAGAKIINGDKVFLRIVNGQIMAWGSPWSGSSPYRVNDNAEVAAIIILSQASVNELYKPDKVTAIGDFSSNVFLPVWERNALANGLAVLDKIVSKVPIYHLRARKDEEAVRLVQRTIFESDKKENAFEKRIKTINKI